MIKVAFEPIGYDNKEFALIKPIEDIEKGLADRGIIWKYKGRDPDLIWGTQRVLLKPGIPRIVHSIRDSATLVWEGRELITKDDVKLVVKASVLRDPRNNNSKIYENVYHGSLVYDVSPNKPAEKPEYPNVIIPEHVLCKTQPVYNWMFTWYLNMYCEDFDEKRDIDVFFAGTTEYHRWYPTEHRRMALEAMRKLPGNVVIMNKCLGIRSFMKMMQRSKVAISPWGFGEVSYRDMQALLAGCFCVKPDTSHMLTWPDYQSMPTMHYCDIDYSNLGEIVTKLLDSWDSSRDIRQATRTWMIEMRKEDKLLDRMAQMIKGALNV